MNSQSINERIIAIYSEWLNDIEERTPSLLTGEFSNSFCTGVPSNWSEKKMRILIVGEEATWGSRDNPGNKYKNYDTELKECQKWILNDLNDKLYGNGQNTCKRSPFWRRIKKIQEEFRQASICWTNIDVINTKKRRKLREEDRLLLHSGIRLLGRVTEEIDPTHILFCGWHNSSLKHEFPDLYREVCPSDCYKDDKKVWKSKDYILPFSKDGRKIIFTYHPSWAKANSDSYIDKILKELKV